MDSSENTVINIIDNTDESPDDTAPAIDAIIHVSTDESELTAYITIEAPQNGGEAPTFESLNKALADSNITTNVDINLLKELATVPIYGCEIVIARGVAPVNGIDGAFALLFDTEKQCANFKENSDGIVNFYDLNIVENVEKGQVLSQIALPTEGTPGISVKGKKLLNRPGKPIQSILGKNTELREDGTAVLAAISGPVEFKGGKINVDEVFSIEGDIDFSTGNIKVASSLSVLGMVMQGFKIEANENIRIRGTVESAYIKAGGNIVLQSGIASSELHCDGDLTCRFIENCNIIVKGNITADYILNSNIKCGKSLKTIGNISKIIGGCCSVVGNIETKTIGSITNVKTKLELLTDCSKIERQAELKSKITELEKTVDSLKQVVTLLRRLAVNNLLTPEKKEFLESAVYSYDVNTKTLEDTKKELEEIVDSINNMGNSKIVCNGTIYPGTAVVIGLSTLSIIEPLSNTAIYFKDGIIHTGTAR